MGGGRRPRAGGGLGVVQLAEAAVVAELSDERGRLGEGVAVVEEAGAVQLDVGLMQRHRAADGERPGRVEVALGEVVALAEVV